MITKIKKICEEIISITHSRLSEETQLILIKERFRLIQALIDSEHIEDLT